MSAVFDLTPAASAAEAFPIRQWFESSYANNHVAVSSQINQFPISENSGQPDFSIFDLDNDGLSLAYFGYHNSNDARITTVYYSGTGSSLTHNIMTGTAGARFLKVLQYIGNPKKFLTISANGRMSEWDFTGVEDASGNPTETVLIADVEDATEMGAVLNSNELIVKWLGDNNNKLLAMHVNAGAARCTTYENSGSGWALVDDATASVTSFTPTRNTCNWEQREILGRHDFMFGASGQWRGLSVTLDASLNITISRNVSAGATVNGAYNFSGVLAMLNTSNSLELMYDTGSSLARQSSGPAAYSSLNSTNLIRPYEHVFGAARFRGDAVSASRAKLIGNFANCVDMSFPNDLHASAGAAFTPARGGVIFTSSADTPYKYCWLLYRDSGGQNSSMSLASI